MVYITDSRRSIKSMMTVKRSSELQDGEEWKVAACRRELSEESDSEESGEEVNKSFDAVRPEFKRRKVEKS